MDVTPPIYTYTKSYVRIKLNTSTYMHRTYVKEELIMEKEEETDSIILWFLNACLLEIPIS